jgi:hypothetical protein
MYWNEYDGSAIGKFDGGLSIPKSDKFRFTFFSVKFAQSYDSWKIFGEAFEPFTKPPSWSMDNYSEYLEQVEAKKHERRNNRRFVLPFTKRKGVDINLLINTKLSDLQERVEMQKPDFIINPRIKSHEVR